MNKALEGRFFILYILYLTIVCDIQYSNDTQYYMEDKGMEKDLVESLLSELRRGTLILGVLSQLDESRYGYALIQSLEEKGMSIDANTLYPLLRRLEKQELLCSEWNTEEAKPRKYYKRTEYGDTVYKIMIEQWNKISEGMAGLIGGNE